MNFLSAMEELELGKKIRKIDWVENAYICRDNEGFVRDQNKCIYAEWARYPFCKWELYEDPKHDFDWAVEQIKSGKTVTRKDRVLSPEDFNSDNWEIWETNK